MAIDALGGLVVPDDSTVAVHRSMGRKRRREE